MWSRIDRRAALRELARSGWKTGSQALLNASLLLNQACLSEDAIVRTLTRLKLTRRRMLEWETAASADRRLGSGLRVCWNNMWSATAPALGFGALVLVMRRESLPAAASKRHIVCGPFDHNDPIPVCVD